MHGQQNIKFWSSYFTRGSASLLNFQPSEFSAISSRAFHMSLVWWRIGLTLYFQL